MSVPDVPSVYILGVKVSAVTLEQSLDVTEHIIHAGARARLSTMNIHGANLAYESPEYRALVNQCELVICDGYGLKWGARLLGQSIPERFTQADLLPLLAELACRRNFTLFFLGGRRGVAEKAAARLKERFPTIRIVGAHHGFFDNASGGPENESVIQAINAVKPHILLIGLGMPLQDRWMIENWDRLEVNIAMTCGALFEYVSGETPRGPRWMTDHGLEWLARLAVEPRRLWRRYLVGNPLFLWRVLKQRLGWVRFQD
jgi:N-acetylglucosaminyldiphosphoundecaprenol N-acetyl-beta-D-mannosaminyltransferase